MSGTWVVSGRSSLDTVLSSRTLDSKMVSMDTTPEGAHGKNAIAGTVSRKQLLKFSTLAGSLETLVSQMAEDWKNTVTTAPGTLAKGKGKDGKAGEDADKTVYPIYGQIRRAQLLFTELHATTRKTHTSIETCR